MKNYSGVSSSAHKKGVQSVGGPGQLNSMTNVNTSMVAGSTNQILQHTSMTPDRHNSNHQVMIGNGAVASQKQQSQQIKLQNQKNSGLANDGSKMTAASASSIPQKQKQIASSQPRSNIIKKAKVNGQQVANNASGNGGLRGSSQQLPSNIESIQQLGTNVNNSMAVMMNARMQQPSPGALANPHVNLLNQNTSIDDILLQQQNFAKQYNNSTALIGSSRKQQKIQIHMKNRFHNRKASGPAALNANNNAAQSLQNKQYLMQQNNVSQDRISNYDSSIQQQPGSQIFDKQSYASQNNIGGQMTQTRTSSRQGGRQNSSQHNAEGSVNGGRPNSKGSRSRKDKANNAVNGQGFGRTFFHPPSGAPGVMSLEATGPSLLDHNHAALASQFNTTGQQAIPTTMKIPQTNMGANHVRAGTQIDGSNSTAAIKAKQYMSRKEGSQDRSTVHFQKPAQLVGGKTTQFDMPSTKHGKSKSVNKFSQPELSRYANSIERIGQLGDGSNLTMQSVGGASNKDKRQNFSLNPQQQAQLKHTLQKGQQKNVDVMLNSAYSLKTTNRKNMKGTQQISKKMLSGVTFPTSLNQTQSVRFAQNGSNKNQGVPVIQNYNASGHMTQSTQSGMSSATQPNAHLIFTEGGPAPPAHFVNTATIPMIKNGEASQQMDQMKSAYANTQMLDRLFNNQSSTSQATVGSSKKRSAKGHSVVALAQSNVSGATKPNTSEFMPSSATSATAFYAASKQAQASNSQMFSNYQIQQKAGKSVSLSVQKQSNSGYAGSATQPLDLARLQSQGGATSSLNGGSTLQQILANQAQQMNSVGGEIKPPSTGNVEKGNKNSYYLKQQLQKGNRSKQGSKDRQGLIKGNTPVLKNEESSALTNQQVQQHRKNHSVVINRAEVLRVDGKLQRQMEASPDRVGQSSKALKLPGMHSQDVHGGASSNHHLYGNSMQSSVAVNNAQINNNYASGFAGDQDYLKGLNQSATNANTRALKTKGSARSIDRQNKQGAMTPSIERANVHQKGGKGSQSINQERQSFMANKMQHLNEHGEQQYPGSSGMNYPQVLNNTKQVMVTDGGTGASLKRVFIQQESTHTSQADSQSNYGSTVQQHTQNYHLPIKGAASAQGITTKQSKRIQMQKVNASKFAKAPTSNVNGGANSTSFPPQGGKKLANMINNVDRNSEKPMTSDTNMQGGSIMGPPEDQTISSSYKTNLESKTGQTLTRAQQKLRTESRKDNRAISVGQGVDYNSIEMQGEEASQDDGQKASKRRSISINITEEALRRGKLATEMVARNMSQNKYDQKGCLKNGQQTKPSPRVIEMMDISERIKQSFDETGEAPETTTDFYRAGKMLGRGAFGKVNLGMHKLTRKLIAIKSINQEYLTDDKQRSKIMHEVGILLRLRHQSVVKLYETFETKRHIMLVMELCAGGDLLNFVRKRKKCEEPLAKVLFRQIIEGIGYIHSKSILHRDIKLDNILLDGKGNVKIADFGVSKTVKPGEVMYEQSGTPAYIAPEIIRNEGYKGFKADLWSAGVVLFALLFGTVPFKANNMKDLHQQILSAKYNMKEQVTDEAKNLIQGLLCTDPKKRLSVRRVLMHPWLAGSELLSTDIFEEAEKEVIRSEFTYNDPSRFNRNERIKEDEEPWDCFTELNLDSMNQTLRNASEKSLILAPFNSTMSDVDQFFKSILSMAEMEEKKTIFKFAARCRDQDRQYEINNNAELDNGVYHKFVYSTKDSKAQDDEKPEAKKGREQEGEGALLSRNSSRAHLNNPAGQTNEESEDLTKARDRTSAGQKKNLKAEREALKADIRRMKDGGGKKGSADQQTDEETSEDELANTNQSHYTIHLDDDRVHTLSQLGYPIDYVKYTILEAQANYCVTAYFMLGTDQNY